MNEGFQFVDIIIFAVVAGLILLRLRNVLGRRTGHQPPPTPPSPSRRDAANDTSDNVVKLPDREGDDEFAVEDYVSVDPEIPDDLDDDDPVLAAGLAQVKKSDGSFTRKGFLEGAEGAFEIIIEAFAAADADRLRDLLDDDVLRSFTRVIEERKEANHVHQTTLVSMDESAVIEAGMNGRTAFVTVRFVTQQINVTHDNDGEVVGGDPSYVATVTDLWTFERDTRSRNPNWKLVATRSPN